MMCLKPQLVPDWPKLAWVARAAEGSSEVEVLHGPMVETADDWIAEAVWDGPFDRGDFDQTDIVFGSGIRVRSGEVAFVSSGSTLDRLWHSETSGTVTVSNSLPALLAVAKLSLRDDYPHYARDIGTIVRGLRGYVDTIPATESKIHLVYYGNLLYDGRRLRVMAKPDSAPSFRSYDQYRTFLTVAAQRLGHNCLHPRRKYRVATLTSISSGYDSPASALVALHAGCRQTVTLRRARSLWRGKDTGKSVAQKLGMACREYDMQWDECRHEVTIWAATGRPAELNLTVFDFPEPLCAFFTGFHGGGVWSREKYDPNRPFQRDNVSGLGLCEFRLFQGLFHIPVPYWGARHVSELRVISDSEELAPWRLDSNYDRPIPRRMIEQASVERGMFGVRKKNTQSETPFPWPFSRSAQASFRAWLRQRSLSCPADWVIPVLRSLAHVDMLVATNVLSHLGLGKGGLRTRLLLPANALLFQWANSVLKEQLAGCLEALKTDGVAAGDTPVSGRSVTRTTGP